MTRALVGQGQIWRHPPIQWSDPSAADQIRERTRAFLGESTGKPWQVAWCAGAGVTATSRDVLQTEIDVFDAFLQELGASAPEVRRKGVVFLASSAGALYAGSTGAPFSESDAVHPLAPYGETKQLLEQMAARWSEAAEVSVLVGRISNLYGPGQTLSKPQGLISQICRAHLLRRPISIYVPLDTLRDYLYVEDCAALVVASLARLRAEGHGAGTYTKILASQRAVTVGTIIGELRRVFKRPPKITYSTSPLAKFQTRDLRLRSVVWPEIDSRPLTPLPVGIHRTIDALTRSLQAGSLS